MKAHTNAGPEDQTLTLDQRLCLWMADGFTPEEVDMLQGHANNGVVTSAREIATCLCQKHKRFVPYLTRRVDELGLKFIKRPKPIVTTPTMPWLGTIERSIVAQLIRQARKTPGMKLVREVMSIETVIFVQGETRQYTWFNIARRARK